MSKYGITITRFFVGSIICLSVHAVSAQNVANVASWSSGSTLLWRGESRDCSLSEPIVHDDLIFIGECTGKFYALEKSTGKEEWAYDTRVDGASGGFRTATVLDNEIVLAGTEGACGPDDKGYLYAFHQHTGKVRWKLRTTITSNSFIILGSMIVFGTQGGVLSVDLKTGQKKWNFGALTTPSNCAARSSIATDGVNVYFLAMDGAIYALGGASGQQLWKQNAPSTVTTGLLLYKDVLYFGVAGYVQSLNIATGQSLGQLKVEGTLEGTFAWLRRGEADFEYSYGTRKHRQKGTLLAFSDEFKGVVWSQETNEAWTSGRPMPWRGLVVAGNCHGDIRAYDGSTGALEWQGRVGGCITGFIHDDSTLYIPVKGGALYAFRPPIK